MTSHPLPVRLSPRPVRALLRRLARSAFAADLRANAALLAGCALVLLSALVVTVLTRDVAVGWEGVVDLRPYR